MNRFLRLEDGRHDKWWIYEARERNGVVEIRLIDNHQSSAALSGKWYTPDRDIFVAWNFEDVTLEWIFDG